MWNRLYCMCLNILLNVGRIVVSRLCWFICYSVFIVGVLCWSSLRNVVSVVGLLVSVVLCVVVVWWMWCMVLVLKLISLGWFSWVRKIFISVVGWVMNSFGLLVVMCWLCCMKLLLIGVIGLFGLSIFLKCLIICIFSCLIWLVVW